MEPSLLTQLSDGNNLFILAGLLMVLLELFVGIDTGLDLIILGSIFVISGFVGLGLNSLLGASLVAIFLVIVYFFLGRQFIKRKIILTTHHTNIDKLVGRVSVVSKHISPMKSGQVKLNNELWRAESDQDLVVGDKVEVVSVEGVTLKVKKIKN